MRNKTLLRRLVLATVSVVALVIPVTVGSSSSAAAATPVTWNVRVGAESPDMAVSAMAFLPSNVWVNVGDTVDWTAMSAEPHTVSFLAPGTDLPDFDPFNPNQTEPVGSSWYDGSSYTNSGIMATQGIFLWQHPATSYHLTFTKVGDFTYYCILHGSMMSGTVHVRPAGTAYPFTQADYNRLGNQQANTALTDGRAAYRQARQAHATTGSTVQVGVDGVGPSGDMFSVMRFVRDRVVVHVGDSVTFSVTGPGAPHTVTFGQEPPLPLFLGPSGDPSSYSGGDLNSGVLAPGTPFKVTFTAAGTFHYICAIHDDMGMVGDVIVVP